MGAIITSYGRVERREQGEGRSEKKSRRQRADWADFFAEE
jgi:hypothetical protein